MQVKPGRVTWQKQMMPSGEINRESEAKLYISNLDYDVSNDDIKLLFSEIGELIRYSIHYDKSGRSKGTAEVIYSSQANALAAIRRYNNMNLDGKPIKIELVGESVVASSAYISIGVLGTGGGRESARVHGNDVRGTAGGRESARVHKPGNQNHPIKKLTAQDLDAELEKYHLEAKRLK
ncbi:hypothetical protein Ddye_028517 [Dipteronia dyeriana]|uniref:RRM domain-containing protein n=1 Tax=Dipteronia dyeriana TaxID=168575 RepID=A0AAD9TCQ1_9ROSI|nr:hypothetical protein Ddye_028517 [Dipteronia dyeriana]